MQHGSTSNRPLAGYLALAGAASIWGGMYVVSKYALDFVPPFTLLWLRYVVGFAVLFALVTRSGLRQPLLNDCRTFMSIGFIGYFVSVGLQFIGTRLSSAHMGAILTSASPAFIVVFARTMLGERLSVRKVLSVVLASFGVLVVVGWESGDGAGSRALLGNLALLGAAGTWALLSVLARRASASYPPLVTTAYAIFWAAIFTTPAMVLEWRYLPVQGLDRPIVWLAIAYLGVVATAGAFFLWNKGLQLVEAGVGSVFFFLQPVVGALLGWLILGEHLGSSFFAGGALILGGVLLVSLPVRKRARLATEGDAE
ncbi:EamA family transporter [Geomonas sp. RF6]|uniref:DMT family transporter n=1 Tax=Geomonas sp. RF6 TaxID=2897342 RepID=UPI001E4A4A8C|nr:EamA family transporter [Geomonas sp. RF6]UFS70119.1 EamA family transporter [Geomonas sp. RF6]